MAAAEAHDPGQSGPVEPAELPDRTRGVHSFWVALAALGIAVLVGLLTTIATQSSLTASRDVGVERKNAIESRLYLEQLLSLLKDVETGQRGYVITGREQFLEPYKRALIQIPLTLAQVKTSMGRSTPQGFSWPELESLIRHREEFSLQAVRVRREVGLSVVNDEKLFDQGKFFMDAIRVQMAQLDAHQIARVDRLSGELLELRTSTAGREWVSAIATSVLVAVGIGLWWMERRRRHWLTGQLAASNAQLGERVASRTAALDTANREIRAFAQAMDKNMEVERSRISREVHDQLGQIFTAIKMICRSIAPDGLATDQRTALLSAIDTGVTTTRRISAELHPPLLDDL
ncbi:MAG: hypothetical protein RLZZ401_360, partial [Pseudomonadota bacterium]